MSRAREILRLIGLEINQNMNDFDHVDYLYDTNTGYLVRNSMDFKKIDIVSYSYGWQGGWSNFKNPYLNINQFRSRVVFYSVERILSLIIVPNSLCTNEGFINNPEFTSVIRIPEFNQNENFLKAYEGNLVLFENKSIIIENLVSVVTEICSYLKEKHFPFFERVKDLQYVNDEIIDKVPQMELHKYIPGKYMNLKKLIIMKLCDNPKHEEFREWLYQAYEKGLKDNPAKYEEKFNQLQSLIEYLDSGKYLDVI